MVENALLYNTKLDCNNEDIKLNVNLKNEKYRRRQIKCKFKNEKYRKRKIKQITKLIKKLSMILK